MTAAVLDRPIVRRSGPARRAVARWAWRTFRRAWRQQVLVLALLTVAVAATTVGLAVATSATKAPQTTVTLAGEYPQLGADVAAIEQAYGHVTVTAHERVTIPGSVATVDLRAQDLATAQQGPSLRLLTGRLPVGSGEVALTRHVAAILGLRVGDTWRAGTRPLRVVGEVENPQDLGDQFALVAPGQADPPASVSVQIRSASTTHFEVHLPSHHPVQIEAESPSAKTAAAIAVLVLGALGLLFVGLVAVAGFTVMAQRRLRSLGMFGSIGATDRHVRMVLLANGAAVGGAGALVGTGLGLGGWLAFAPRLETLAGHRIDRLDLPWWAIGAAMLLAVTTALAAAWWPARTVARIPVVAALSGRPPPPQPARRFAAVGGILATSGLVLLAVAQQHRPLLVAGATVITTCGVLLLAPLSIQALAALGRRAPVGIRLALRDLVRYQSRSGAALGAITLAVGISVAIAVSASAQAATATTGTNLAANQLIVYLSSEGGRSGALLPDVTPDQLQTSRDRVGDIAASLHTPTVLPLQAALSPSAPLIPGNGRGGRDTAALVKVASTGKGFSVTVGVGLYVATPELLAHYGIAASRIDATADILTSRTDLAGLQLGYGLRNFVPHPKIQTIDLPRDTSGPNTLIAPREVEALGLETHPSGWLVQTAAPITVTQALSAQKVAASAGLTVETRDSRRSHTQLGKDATAAGVLLALGVLAMTVGLIRSETANDLRTLAATGATSTTRRTLTGATAGALALLGALVGTTGAYLALVAFRRSSLGPLGHVPVFDLAVVIVGLPVVAIGGGWLLAGREPPAVARRPME